MDPRLCYGVKDAWKYFNDKLTDAMQKLKQNANYFGQGVLPEARLFADRSSAKNKAEAAYSRAMGLVNREDWVSASPHLKRAAELQPQSATYQYAFATCLSKSAPKEGSETELKSHMLHVCQIFEKALQLAEDTRELNTSQLQKACWSCAVVYRLCGKLEDARRIVEYGLQRVPQDQELLDALTNLLLDSGNYEDAERVVVQLLELTPESSEARKLWKQIRQQQGRSLVPDIPEETRKQIYSSYHAVEDVKLMDRAPEISKTKNPHQWLAEVSREVSQHARDSVVNEYRIKNFELDLILHEGKRESWPTPTFFKSSGQPARAAFRDSLTCEYCSKRNVAPFWPENGDLVPFYFQSKERTLKQPGKFSLPIECGFCRKVWYVVWDQNPDPLASQFVHHLNGMCNSFENYIFLRLISDDILGEVLSFLRKSAISCINSGERSENSFQTSEWYNLVWLLPVRLTEAADYLNHSYLMQLETAAQEWHDQGRVRDFIHWVYCFDGHTGALNLTVLPGNKHAEALPGVFARELLSSEERSGLGLTN